MCGAGGTEVLDILASSVCLNHFVLQVEFYKGELKSEPLDKFFTGKKKNKR